MSATTEIAQEIDAHLKRFEADPEINRRNERYGTQRFWNAGAAATGNGRVSVRYVSYQGSNTLTKREAIAYLAWLDAGHAGRHFEQQREEAE